MSWQDIETFDRWMQRHEDISRMMQEMSEVRFSGDLHKALQMIEPIHKQLRRDSVRLYLNDF